MHAVEVIVAFALTSATASIEMSTLSLHDALPIYPNALSGSSALLASATRNRAGVSCGASARARPISGSDRSEEHTSELQSHSDLVCRLLLAKKNPAAGPSLYSHHRHHAPPSHHTK